MSRFLKALSVKQGSLDRLGHLPRLIAISSTATNDIRPIKGPLQIPSGWAWLWWAIGLLLSAALVYCLWRWWRKKPVEAAPVVVVSPHERAQQRLQAALALIDQPKLFTIEVCDTVRLYLEERFELRAPERATEEFLFELQSAPVLSSTQKESLGDFLSRCDLVKFARYEPLRPELHEIYDAAVRLVEETRPVPTPITAENMGVEQSTATKDS